VIRIRRILDASAPANKEAIEQVKIILKEQFSALKDKEINAIASKLNNPLKYKFQSRLIIAENLKGEINGFALLLHVPDINFCYLDYIATRNKYIGRGLGGALYSAVRAEAINLKSEVLLMECLPDDEVLSPNKEIREQNIKRLAFYERYKVYPIIGTKYETPVKPEDTDPPYLVADILNHDVLPNEDFMRKAVDAILRRKYGYLCSEEYIVNVVSSIHDGAYYLRSAQYTKPKKTSVYANVDCADKIYVVANEGHEIHHIKERGYVESPVRLRVILKEIHKLPFVQKIKSHKWSNKYIHEVHDVNYVKFIKNASMKVPDGKSVYPYVFPIRNQERKPDDSSLHAGYYCIDSFTPINKNAYKAARAGVDCTLTAASMLLEDKKIAYALVRPPGHHAEKASYGGFCYYSNNAIAANYLSKYGKVAILDIDYHHGNGQQNIFYNRKDVLTISIHGHPKFAYPYFTGFDNEKGEDIGKGYNINNPLPEIITFDEYMHVLEKMLDKINKFNPAFLVVALGLDTAKSDPTGSWGFNGDNFNALGVSIAKCNKPTLVVQEGGYNTHSLGSNAKKFLSGIYQGIRG